MQWVAWTSFDFGPPRLWSTLRPSSLLLRHPRLAGIEITWACQSIAFWCSIFTVGIVVQTATDTSVAQICIGRFIAGAPLSLPRSLQSTDRGLQVWECELSDLGFAAVLGC